MGFLSLPDVVRDEDVCPPLPRPLARVEADLLLAWSRSIVDHRLRYEEWLLLVVLDPGHESYLLARIAETLR